MKEYTTIKELPPSERPYERCLQHGPEYLTDAELLAVILRTGTKGKPSTYLANQILSHAKGQEGLLSLYHLSVEQVMQIPGVGKVKAVQVMCITELSKRISKTIARGELVFHHPQSIANYYMEELRHLEKETIICMMLNTKNNLLGEEVISQGTVNSTLISPREVFLSALSFRAVNIILIHNHPSGDPNPSKEDIQITHRVKDAGNLIGIKLLDHIIIGDQQYTSMREDGHF